MKRILIFLIGFSLLTFALEAQITVETKIDSSTKALIKPNLLDNNIINLLQPTVIDSNFLISVPLWSSFNQINKSKVDRMPCLIPKGNFPMLIVKPDSTRNYTLLIKYL